MKKILCPTDFSEAAHGAIEYAAKLAQKLDGDLTLFHVHSLFDLRPADLLWQGSHAESVLSDELEVESRQVSRAYRIPCYGEVVSSARPLSRAISDRARRCDLVVMGTDGASDLYQILSGSNTYNTIVQTQVPLLLIPEGCEYSEIRAITYAYNFIKEATLPIAPLTHFARRLNASITVLQVFEDDQSIYVLDQISDIESTIQRISRPGMPLEFEAISSTNVVQALTDYMRNCDSQVMALCAVQRGFIERIFHRSVIRQLADNTRRPLFVFPD